jgi:outer membrane protein
LQVQERSLKILEDLLLMNQEKVKAGFMSRIDLLQTESNIASRRASLLDVRRNLENTQDRLKQLLNPGGKNQNLGWDTNLLPSDQPLFKAYPVSVENSYTVALAQRPDYLAQALSLSNSQLQEEIAAQNRLPQLNLQGSSGLQSLDGNLGGALGKLFSFQTYYWSLGLNYEMPVIGNSFEAIYQQASLQRQQQEARMAESRQAILRDIRQASRNVEMTAQQVEATRIAKKLAEEQLKAQTEKLNLGLTTNFQVLQFQSDFESASLAEVNAVVENIRAINQLQKTEGTLLEAVGLKWENT